MNVEVTKLPESRVALKIDLTSEEVAQALDRTYKRLVQRVAIPGFRKGKAPRPVLERAVGPEWFLHEATDEAVRWGYRKAVDQEHLVPIDEAEIDIGEVHSHIEVEQPFHFEATVSVRPDVQLPDYSTLQIERRQVEVEETDVAELLAAIRERNATLEPVARAARVGDVVTLNLHARVDGKEVINNENAEYELLDEEFDSEDPVLPGLSRALLGSVPGDIREPLLFLPKSYSTPELAGKTMISRVLVKEVKRKVLPSMDDELAQSVSAFQTLDELKDTLRSNIDLERRMEADQRLAEEAVEAVTSRTFVEIPPVLIEEELDRLLDEMRESFESRHLSWQQYLDAAQRTDADMRTELREVAIENVKQSLVLSAVADQEGIDVTNQEIIAAMDELFRQAGTDDPERRRLRNSAGVRANIRSRIRRQRAIQRLVHVMSGGEEVSSEAAEAVADVTAAVAEDNQETLAVEAVG